MAGIEAAPAEAGPGVCGRGRRGPIDTAGVNEAAAGAGSA